MKPLLILALPFLALDAFAQFHLELTSERFPSADGTIAMQIHVVNATAFEAQNVSVNHNGGAAFVDVPSAEWSCAPQFLGADCKLGHPLAPGASAVLDLRVRFDQPYQRRGIGAMGIADVDGQNVRPFVTDDTPALYRRFMVTQSGDSGAGSLRAAIEALNADPLCATVPCSVDFEVASDDAVKRIALQSPLPQIAAADVLIDGGAQQIEIDGAATGSGNGIDFARVDRGAVSGLALGNFPDNAILVRNRHRTTGFDATARLYVSNCHIGVDATGARAMPNFRGISIGPGWFGGGAIRDSVISHNIRTGIFDWAEHDPGLPTEPILLVERNVISDNGASGIFLGEGSDGALLRDNVIERNRDFGVALARGAINSRIFANTIAHNGNSAVDLGLDGPGRFVTDRRVPSPFGDRRPPVIASAVYDPVTGTTTLRGTPVVEPIRAGCDICRTNLISIYANDAADHGEYAEAQTYLGEAKPSGAGFVFTYKGDLRGKYLTALDTRWLNIEATNFFDVGELSKAFLVH